MSECLNGGESRTLFEDLGPVTAMPTGTYRGMTGSIVKLKDGSLLWALPALGDAPLTGIVGRISTDGGRTWGKSFSMQPGVPGVEELICPNLRRLPSGELLFFYTMLIHGETYAHTYVRRSGDEGRSWSHPLCATPYPGGRYTQPDKIIQLAKGRIVIPVEEHGPKGYMIALCYYSDDNGFAWYPSKKPADAGFETDEPSIVELKDGRLLMIFRTTRGYLGKAFSKDRGETWAEEQLTKLPSPCAPEFITRIPGTGHLLILWCNNPHAPALARGERQPTVQVAQLKMALGHVRSPMSSAVSRDEGETWEHVRDIARNPAEGVYGDYGYPGVTFIDNGKIALVHYNATDGIHLARIGVEWFYGK
jgi:sialidase-1